MTTMMLTTMTATPPEPAAERGPRLRVSREAAGRHLRMQIGRGMQLRRRRLRDLPGLDEARADKQAWVHGYTQFLLQAFDVESVAQSCNDWVGRIFPEYAPPALFIEHFHEELDHRLSRLQALLEQLDEAIEPAHVAPPVAVVDRDDSTEDLVIPPLPTELQTTAGLPGVLVRLGSVGDTGETVARFVAELGVRLVSLDVGADADEADEADEWFTQVEAGPVARFALVLVGQEWSADVRTAFRLGHLAGRVGRQRVCLVSAPGCAPAHGGTALADVPQITMDGTGGWQLELARLLRRAGATVDLNRLL